MGGGLVSKEGADGTMADTSGDETNPAEAPSRPPPSRPPPSRPVYARQEPKSDNSCVKYTLFVTNVLVLLLGLVILIMGIVLLARGSSKEMGSYMGAVESIRESAISAVFLGVVLFFTGFLGCWGAAKGNTCMLATYIAILVVAIMIEIAIMALALTYVSSSKLDSVVSQRLEDIITGGSRDKDDWDEMRDTNFLYNVQENLKCCGAHGFQDYTRMDRSVPNSCYFLDDHNAPRLHHQGCVQALKHYLRSNGLSIGLVALFSFFLKICAVVAAGFLISSSRAVKNIV